MKNFHDQNDINIDIADFFPLTSSNEPSHLFQSFSRKIKSINLFIGTESTIHATLLLSKKWKVKGKPSQTYDW